MNALRKSYLNMIRIKQGKLYLSISIRRVAVKSSAVSV